MWWYMSKNPALRRQRQEDYYEFEDCLDYLVSFRLALVTRIKPLNQKQRRSFSWLMSSEVT